MSSEKTILLDVGGTFIKCSDGRSVPINSSGTREEIVAALKEAIWGGQASVGDSILLRAAVPGPFDYGTGQFLMKHKFASVYGEYFADLVGLPRENCRFIHDVNCMLLGEVRNYASDSHKIRKNTALVALGTGLGFAMMVDGEILSNEYGSPAVSIFNRAYRDGILEDYASKRGMLRLYGCDDLTVKEIGRKAMEGDSKAAEAFARMGEIIGEAIAPVLKEYMIKNLVLGGQISRNWRFFLPALRDRLEKDGLYGIEAGPIEDFDNATFKGLELL